MAPDWHEWHRVYDAADSPLARRLAVVQRCIRDALDRAPAGPIVAISMCAGEGRDLLEVLADHPRRGDVRGRLVELDPGLAAAARAHAPVGVDVLCADAGAPGSYAGYVPADLVLVCGVFGNISDADIENVLRSLPGLCAPGATVIWTRHRREPDATITIRALLAELQFDEITFDRPADAIFGVGSHRFRGESAPFDPSARLFAFVGFDALTETCPECGFSYEAGRNEVMAWLPSDTRVFVERFSELDDASARRRPEPDTWSPLEYACHVRDILIIQRERIELAQQEWEPTFVPMRRDERVIELRYNEQDPAVVAAELRDAAAALTSTLAGLDDAGWQRQGVYNYPQPQLRTVEWIGVHTVHELLHHRGDITQKE